MLSWIFILLVIDQNEALKLLSFMRKLEKMYNVKVANTIEKVKDITISSFPK